ncbi:unnamed protein product [Plutella xylostella]|uniref:ABC-type xenobiotic transporter n=1 Tax=Plutella xylostella TaxID=51655 RepID=A0A8S4G459_PLUXY|nr:unnamed protein product [Plutella xylostella]
MARATTRHLITTREPLRSVAAVHTALAYFNRVQTCTAGGSHHVIPLSADCAVMQYLEDHVTVRSMVAKKYNLNEITASVRRPPDDELILASAAATLAQHRQLSDRVPAHALRSSIEEDSGSLQDFLQKKRKFAETLGSNAIYAWILEPGYVLYPIVYFVAGASCLCWLVHFGYVLALRHRLGPSSRGPTSLLVCWGAAVVLNILSLRSNSMAGASIASDIATLCCHGLYLLTLVPHSQTRQTYYSPCLVGSQHNHNEYTPLLPHIDDGILGTAMQGAGLWSKLTFSWVEPLFLKGLENKLDDPEELFDVPANVGCSYVGARIDKALIGNVDIYQQYVEVPHEPFISSGYGATGESIPQSSTPVTPNSRVLVRPARRQNVTLFRALHSCFAVQFYSIGVLKFTSDMAGFAGPMLLNKLVTFVQDGSMDIHYGYMYAGGLLASTLTQAIFNSHFNWNMALIGIKMQGAIVSTILRKTLSVTSTELNKVFSIGEITNFMSTDTDRIVNSCPSFHALWSIPLQLFITLFLLYQQVGISFLAGVGFSVVLIPINKVIANKIGRLSTELMRHKDARVNFVTDMLKGIRTVKMHVWEDYFINRVNDARTLELRYLRLRKLLDALCVVLWATTPVLVAALTLGVHALRGATLNAPTVFTTVALVNMLISPLNAFPWVLNGLTEAWVSVKRIQKLLELPDMDPERYYDRLNTNRDEEKMIIFNNASFSWAKPSDKKKPPPKTKKNKGKSKRKTSKANLQRRDSISSVDAVPSDQPFTLRNINLDIGREDFIGIAGPVGSGKTSLLHAIIGDMIKKGGDIQIPEHLDSFGYVSQSAWLVRGTIRDNILFGKPYDEAKFRAVVDACALTEDLNVLGWAAAAGDGGCTLSGGQRARVALARAVYQDKQVYLLDDVLSGVDARVAQHIMQRCILGLLKRTTRVLVAHSPKHLARANTVLLMKDGKIVKQGPPETVLNDIEEYLPSETESIGEEPAQAPPKDDEQTDVVSQDSLAQYEGMSQGTVRWWVVGLYLRSIGFFLSTAIVLSLILMQVSQNFTFLWLAYWVKNRASNATTLEITHENTTFLDHGFNAIDTVIHSIINGTLFKKDANVNATKLNEQLGGETLMPNSDMFYLEVYFGLAGLNVVFTVMRAFLFAYGGVQAATRMHRMLLKSVVKAEVKFFDTTPLGRIVNRFSSDTYTVDDSLPFILNILLAQLFSLVGALSVTLYGVPYVAVALVPLLPVYYWLQRRYRVSSRQLKRLQSVTLTPVYSHFSDTLQGAQHTARVEAAEHNASFTISSSRLVCTSPLRRAYASTSSVSVELGWVEILMEINLRPCNVI